MNDDYDYIKAFFKEHAGIYDIVSAPMAGVRKRVAGLVDGKSEEILDVATGTGKQAFAFAKKGHSVTGIDLSEDMLGIARKKNKYENVRFETGDATSMAFEDSRFDVTCISFALHDMPGSFWGSVVQEMVRVTKANGTIIIVDYYLPRNKTGRYIAYNFIKSYETKYYPDYVKFDFRPLLGESGVRIEEEVPVLLRTARIFKGVKSDALQ